ncbi:MAG: ClbS/DfsB family four-helix bundle protein [Thermomicrobiales bacterium]
MTDPTTKAALLAQVHAADRALSASYAGVDRATMEEPGVNDGWSIKDEIAHLTYWNQTLVTRLAAAATGTAPDPAVFIQSEEEMHARNARCFAESARRPLDDVLSDYRETFAAVIDRITALPDADLFAPHRFAWAKGESLREVIAGETYEHYPEHIAQITAWVATHAKQGTQ